MRAGDLHAGGQSTRPVLGPSTGPNDDRGSETDDVDDRRSQQGVSVSLRVPRRRARRDRARARTGPTVRGRPRHASRRTMTRWTVAPGESISWTTANPAAANVESSPVYPTAAGIRSPAART